MVSIEEIKEKVSHDPNWAQRALVVLFNSQTADEQAIEATRHHNDKGFNGIDANILSSFAKQVRNGRTLSEKQLAIAFKKLPKYSRQLLEEAENKTAQKLTQTLA